MRVKNILICISLILLSVLSFGLISNNQIKAVNASTTNNTIFRYEFNFFGTLKSGVPQQLSFDGNTGGKLWILSNITLNFNNGYSATSSDIITVGNSNAYAFYDTYSGYSGGKSNYLLRTTSRNFESSFIFECSYSNLTISSFYLDGFTVENTDFYSDYKWLFTINTDFTTPSSNKVGVPLTNFYDYQFIDYDGTILDSSRVEENTIIAFNGALPTRSGYKFIGWDYDLTQPITDNLTITAQYVKLYLIKFLNDDGSIFFEYYGEENSHPTTYSRIPQKVGYTFKDWGVNLNDIFITGLLTFSPNFEINKYAVTFKVDNVVISENLINYNTYSSIPSLDLIPQKIGYDFIGWDKDPNSTLITEDTIFNAVYKLHIYNISINCPDYVEILRLNYVGEYPYIRYYAPAFSTIHFYFKVPDAYFNDKVSFKLNGIIQSYQKLDDNRYYIFIENILTDLDFELNFVINLYNVNFYDEDKITLIKSLYNVEHGTILEHFNQGKYGYYFEGWFNVSDDKKFNYEAITQGLNLYSKFSKIHKVIILNYNDKVLADLEIINGRKIDYNVVPERQDYSFIGWFFNDELIDFDNYIVGSDLTIKAKFNLIQFTVTFYYDADNTLTKLFNINSILVEPVFTSDKVFMYWIQYDFNNINNVLNESGNLPTFVNENLYFKAKFKNVENNDIVVEDISLYERLKLDLWEPIDTDAEVSGNFLQKLLYNVIMFLPKCAINVILWFLLESPLFSQLLDLVTGGYLKVFVFNLAYIQQLSSILYIGSLAVSLIILYFGIRFIM